MRRRQRCQLDRHPLYYHEPQAVLQSLLTPSHAISSHPRDVPFSPVRSHPLLCPIDPYPPCSNEAHRDDNLAAERGLGVGVELEHGAEVLDWVLLERCMLGGAGLLGAHRGLDLVGVDEAGEVRVGHQGTGQGVALLHCRGGGVGAEDLGKGEQGGGK